MTHQEDYNLTSDLIEKGLDAVPELMRVLINNVMQVERSKYLQAGEYERKSEKGMPTGISRKQCAPELERSPLQCHKYEKEGFTLRHWKKD